MCERLFLSGDGLSFVTLESQAAGCSEHCSILERALKPVAAAAMGRHFVCCVK